MSEGFNYGWDEAVVNLTDDSGSGESSTAPVSAARKARSEARSNLRYALEALSSRYGLTDEQKAQYLATAQTHVEAALNAIQSAQTALTS